MVAVADEVGADARLVPVMQYLRVAIVAATVPLVATLIHAHGHRHVVPDPPSAGDSAAILASLLAVVGAGLWLGGRVHVPVPALALGVVAASPAAAESKGEAGNDGRAPVARASGSDAGPPVYPGLVNSRLVRTQKALDRAVDYADDDETAKAVSSLYAARLQVKLAWKAAKYTIQNAPPPPAGDGLRASAQRKRVRVRVRVRARKSGAAPAGGTVADQYTTAGGVISMQHTVAQTAIGMIDMARGPLRDSLSRTIFTPLDQRDAAVAYIHSIDTPPPAGDGLARASGTPVGGSWATVMAPVAGDLDDEVNQIEGALALSSTMGAGIRRVLKDAEFQVVKTQRNINQYWPPVIDD